MTIGWNWRKRWEFKLMLKCKHQFHCVSSSEIGTCIINYAVNYSVRQAAHKKQRKYTSLVESRLSRLYTNVLKVYINFRHKKNFKKTNKINDITVYLQVIIFLLADATATEISNCSYFSNNLHLLRLQDLCIA